MKFPSGNKAVEVGVSTVVVRVRKEQGISQLELSQAANVGRRFVVELEAGKETIPVALI